MSTTDYRERLDVHRETAIFGALAVNTVVLAMLAYHVLSPNEIRGIVPVLVPLVWIPVGVVAIVATDPPAADQRQRTIGVAVATAYFGLLGYFGGVWGRALTELPYGVDYALFSSPPGWAPRMVVNTPVLFLNLQPWQIVGYLALAYLIYVAVLDASGTAISGVLGFLSCVSCTWPVLATLVSSVLGGTGAVAGVVYDQSYLLSTGVFVVTVALLYWRPGWK